MRVFLLFLIVFVGLSSVPALAQVDETGPPKTFQSPFNGERRLADPEGKDYTKLQELYDFWRDDEIAVDRARKNGSAEDVARAEALLKRSDAAFHDALDQYVEDWSAFNFPKHYRPNPNARPDDFTNRFKSDRKLVLALLEKNHKSTIPSENHSPKGQPAKPSANCNKGGGLSGPLETLACEENKK